MGYYHKTYVFNPKSDITTWELACILSNCTDASGNVNLHVSEHYYNRFYNNGKLSKHFRKNDIWIKEYGD